MSGKKQIGPRIDADLWERFLDHVEEKHGRTRGVTGEEVERALESWIEGTDVDHLERRMASMEDQISALADSVSDANLERENGSSSSQNFNARTKKNLSAITDALPDGEISDDIMEHVIEDAAGVTSRKTIKKYKRLLRNRGHAFPEPLSGGPDNLDPEKWVVGPERFALRLETNDAYPPETVDNIFGFYEQYLGDDWFFEALPDDYLEGNRLKLEKLSEKFQSIADQYRKKHRLDTPGDDPSVGRTFQ